MALADNNIKGKLAFITGASGGYASSSSKIITTRFKFHLPPNLFLTTDLSNSIGSAIARGLLLQDVDLALHYTSNTLAIEDLVAQLRKDYETHVHPAEDRFLRITTHQADLSTKEGALGLLEDVRKQQGNSSLHTGALA